MEREGDEEQFNGETKIDSANTFFPASRVRCVGRCFKQLCASRSCYQLKSHLHIIHSNIWKITYIEPPAEDTVMAQLRLKISSKEILEKLGLHSMFLCPSELLSVIRRFDAKSLQ
jgi:hypothetical protein